MPIRTLIVTTALSLTLAGAAFAEDQAATPSAATGVAATAAVTASPAVKAKRLAGDANSDGKVSKEEFIAEGQKRFLVTQEKRFADTDANSDGFITVEERDAFNVRRAAERQNKTSAADMDSATPAAGGDVSQPAEKPSFLSRLFGKKD